jgi:hypothetical protein
VSRVSGEPTRPLWTKRAVAFTEANGHSAEDLLSGRDHFHPLEMSDPICFEIHVPIKNQPKFADFDDIPTDSYWAAWDGVTLLVLWARDETEQKAARSAGHIAEDILRTAAERIHMNLVVQACSPHCQNMFAHRTLRIAQADVADNASNAFQFEGTKPGAVEVRLEFNGNPLALTNALHSIIGRSGQSFASFKNLSRRIIDVEQLARTLVDELLVLDYALLAQSKRNIFVRFGQRIAGIWHALWGRGDSRRSRQLISSLWITMSRIESLRRDWAQVQRRFGEQTARYGLQALYDIDSKDDKAVVEAIDTQFVRAAVEHKSARRDNRIVSWATFGGAIAGVLAALVTAAFSFNLAG